MNYIETIKKEIERFIPVADSIRDPQSTDPIIRNLDARDIYFALSLDNSDVDMAKRLLAVWGDRHRFSKALGGLSWDGNRWRIEEKDDAPLLRAAQEIAEKMTKEPRVAQLVAESGILPELVHFTSKKEATKARSEMPDAWIISHEEMVARVRAAKSSKALRGMVDVALNHLSIESSDLDQKRNLITTPIGTVNLKDRKISPNLPANLMTKMTPVAPAVVKGAVHFDPAKAPVWMKALDDAFLGDQDLIDYVQRLVGYVITGEITEQKFWFLFGSGSNMKGIFCNVLQSLVPEHSTDLDVGFLMKQHGNRKQMGGTNEELANLRGARLIHAEEGSADDVLDEGPMKRISGGGVFEVAKKYKSATRFKPEGKILFETNHRPRILSQDPAIWRRIVEIPFKAHFADAGDAGYVAGVSKPKDPQLLSKLQAELPHILAWAIEGSVEYYANGNLNPEPAAIVEARENYKQDTDVLSDFITAACYKSEHDRVRAGDLYESYKQFSEMNSAGRPISTRAFSAALGERGYGHEKKGGVIWRTGLNLNSAGTCYRNGRFPEIVSFRWKCGNLTGKADSIDDLPEGIRDIVVPATRGAVPEIGRGVMTNLGLFERVA